MWALYKKAAKAERGDDADCADALDEKLDFRLTLDAKLGAEFTSGTHIGDIAYTGSTDMMQYAAKGWLTPFTPATVASSSDLTAGSVGPDNAFYGVTVSVAGALVRASLRPFHAVEALLRILQ